MLIENFAIGKRYWTFAVFDSEIYFFGSNQMIQKLQIIAKMNYSIGFPSKNVSTNPEILPPNKGGDRGN